MSEAPYTVGKWAGLDNYQCSLCPFATLNAEEIVAHIAARHTPAAPEVLGSGLVLVADKSGREVTLPPTPILQEEAGESIELTTDEIAALQEPPAGIVKRAYKRREV